MATNNPNSDSGLSPGAGNTLVASQSKRRATRKADQEDGTLRVRIDYRFPRVRLAVLARAIFALLRADGDPLEAARLLQISLDRGLHPNVRQDLMGFIAQLRTTGISIAESEAAAKARAQQIAREDPYAIQVNNVCQENLAGPAQRISVTPATLLQSAYQAAPGSIGQTQPRPARPKIEKPGHKPPLPPRPEL